MARRVTPEELTDWLSATHTTVDQLAQAIGRHPRTVRGWMRAPSRRRGHDGQPPPELRFALHMLAPSALLPEECAQLDCLEYVFPDGDSIFCWEHR